LRILENPHPLEHKPTHRLMEKCEQRKLQKQKNQCFADDRKTVKKYCILPNAQWGSLFEIAYGSVIFVKIFLTLVISIKKSIDAACGPS